MKNLPQLPYAIAAIAVWLLAGALSFQMCNSANTAFLIAFLAAWFTWRLGTDKANSYEAELEDPPARLYNLSRAEIFETTKEAVLDHVQDKLWYPNSVDEMPDQDGNIRMKFLMTYEEELPTKPPTRIKRRLILDITMAKVTSYTSVKLNYHVDSTYIRWAANEILQCTTEMIWTHLDKFAATKGATL